MTLIVLYPAATLLSYTIAMALARRFGPWPVSKWWRIRQIVICAVLIIAGYLLAGNYILP